MTIIYYRGNNRVMDNKTFNQDRITALRLAHKLTQEEFARKLGPTFSKQHISNWENGKSVPDTVSLLAIANAFGLSMDYFFTSDNYHCNKGKVSNQ